MILIEASTEYNILRHLDDYPEQLMLNFLDMMIVIYTEGIGTFSTGFNMNRKLFFATTSST